MPTVASPTPVIEQQTWVEPRSHCISVNHGYERKQCPVHNCPFQTRTQQERFHIRQIKDSVIIAKKVNSQDAQNVKFSKRMSDQHISNQKMFRMDQEKDRERNACCQ
jgi:hypothetical protein